MEKMASDLQALAPPDVRVDTDVETALQDMCVKTKGRKRAKSV